ncbi:MAG: DUF2157 domain-containing protein [Magnetococcus sp. WYHC-3]
MGSCLHAARRWRDAGLITAEQLDAITCHEQAVSTGGRLPVAFAVLGFATMALGVLALVAANWQQLPPGGKLGGLLTLLMLTCAGWWRVTWRGEPKAPQLGDGLLILLMGLGLGYVALLSQAFPRQESLLDVGTLWVVCVAPWTFLARGWLPALVWTPLAWFAVWGHLEAGGWLHPFLPDGEVSTELVTAHGGILVAAAGLLRIVPAFSVHGRILLALAGFLGVCLLLLGDQLQGRYASDWPAPNMFPLLWFWAVAGILGLLVLPQWASTPRARGLARLTWGMFLLHGVLRPVLHPEGFSVLLLSVAVLLSLALWLGVERRYALFRATLLLTMLLLLGHYAAAVAGLMSTGWGLILLGGALLGMVWLWHIHGRRVERFLEAWG